MKLEGIVVRRNKLLWIVIFIVMLLATAITLWAAFAHWGW